MLNEKYKIASPQPRRGHLFEAPTEPSPEILEEKVWVFSGTTHLMNSFAFFFFFFTLCLLQLNQKAQVSEYSVVVQIHNCED